MEPPTQSRPAGYSPNSRRQARSELRRAIRWAQVEGLVSRNVAALSNPVRVGGPDRRTMTLDEAKVFLEPIRGEPFGAPYVVALSLGSRVSVLLAVDWNVVLDPLDGGRPTITIHRGLKTNAGERIL